MATPTTLSYAGYPVTPDWKYVRYTDQYGQSHNIFFNPSNVSDNFSTTGDQPNSLLEFLGGKAEINTNGYVSGVRETGSPTYANQISQLLAPTTKSGAYMPTATVNADKIVNVNKSSDDSQLSKVTGQTDSAGSSSSSQGGIKSVLINGDRYEIGSNAYKAAIAAGGVPGGSDSSAVSQGISGQTGVASTIQGPGVTQNLGPGSTGPEVQKLQQWLVSQGYMTQGQMNTGPGIYGPQTKAAVAAWQQANNIDTAGNPGYFGPRSMAYISNQSTSGNTGSLGVGSTNGVSALPSTGNPVLDQIQQKIQELSSGNKLNVPPGLQITPALTNQFLKWAHQAVDPQTQQLIQSEITNINASLKNLATQYQDQQSQVAQEFGTNLATEQNQAGGSGTAFSGLRNLTERNMAASTNRTLDSLASDAAYNMGSGARAAAANVGSSNAGNINLPSLQASRVSIAGGSRGSFSPANTLDFNYNPSLYTAGVIPTNQNTAVNNLEANYLSQYGTLAGNNSGRSMKDLIGGITGLPAGYKVPSDLM